MIQKQWSYLKHSSVKHPLIKLNIIHYRYPRPPSRYVSGIHPFVVKKEKLKKRADQQVEALSSDPFVMRC